MGHLCVCVLRFDQSADRFVVQHGEGNPLRVKPSNLVQDEEATVPTARVLS